MNLGLIVLRGATLKQELLSPLSRAGSEASVGLCLSGGRISFGTPMDLEQR